MNITTPPKTAIQVAPSATLAINEYSNQLLAQGKTVYKLGFGQSPFPVPQILVNTLIKHAHEKDYLPVRGLLKLRKAISSYYKRHHQITANSETILIGPGSKELIYNFQLAYDFDTLLLPMPSWVSYEPQAKLTNKKVKWLQTDASANWKISPEIMAEQIQENDGNCVLILNYPSNPLGVTYTESELKAIASFCKQQGILIISDEIYGEVTHSQPHHTMAKFYPEGTIVSGGLSKWAGAGGWRLGYFVMPKALKTIADAMAVIASETFTSVSAPIQYAAVEAFKENTALEVYIQHSKKILETVANYTYQELKTAGVEMPAPEGGFYLFPTFNKWLPALKQKGINNSETFCKVLLEESGVALLPGNVFGHRNTSISARLSYVDFDGKQLLDVLEANPNKQLGADFVKQNCPRIVNGIKSLITWLENL